MTQIEQPPIPDAALMRLERLVGTWDLTGRPLDSPTDNISGRVTIEWLPGGFFMQQRGGLVFMGATVQSLEIIGYDPSTKIFTAHVYSSMGGVPLRYYWDVQGDVVTHWTDGAKYTGTFSADGRTLAGGWRPDQGVEQAPWNTYDATMVRVT